MNEELFGVKTTIPQDVGFKKRNDYI